MLLLNQWSCGLWRNMMKHHFLPPHLVIKAGIHGLGIFTTKDIKKGDVIFTMKGSVLYKPTQTSVQIGRMMHIENPISAHVNHHCEPNSTVDRKKRSFISTKDIKKDEEITFNYNQNEDTLASPFVCACCHISIKGKKFSTKQKRKVTI